MNRRLALKQLAAFAALSSLGATAYAQRAGGPAFETLPTRISPEVAGKIEVIEFFHYGCPHCRDFDPLIEHWLKSLPKDVSFRRVPAIWGNAQLRELARLYYTIERAGLIDTLHAAVFPAMQDRKMPLHTEAGVRDWIGGFQVDAKAFMDTYKSFGLQAQVQRAEQVAGAYKVKGVPTMAVGGRYTTSASLSGSHENTLKVVDELIAKVRSE